MNRRGGFAVMLLTFPVWLLLAAAATAGEARYKCPLDAQTCLNKMVVKFKTSGWLGIEYDDAEGPKALKVTKVVPGSPAEASGFKAGDILVSVNGAKFTDNTEQRCATCERMKDLWKPGTKVQYVVNRSGREVALEPTLAPLPSDVMAMMIGMHLLEHAKPEPAQK